MFSTAADAADERDVIAMFTTSADVADVSGNDKVAT